MKNLYLLLSIILLPTQGIVGQDICGSKLNLLAIQQNDPARYQRILAMEQHIRQYVKSPQPLTHGQLHVTIPVVVHVLHNEEPVGTGLNISMAQVQSQIDVLNEDFRRLNADKNQTPSAFVGVAADVGIEFILACVDPVGNPTNGIVRVGTNNNPYLMEDSNNNNIIDPEEEVAAGIKYAPTGSEAWPADRYLNIWVCNLEGALKGYGQFPDQLATNPETDGVVVNTTSFGRTGNVTAPYHLGRIATHEVGHWLNLRHIWGDAICGNDLVADTPQQEGSSSGCPTHPRSSCGSGDMFMNFMDYTNNACMNLFTEGQSKRMLALFNQGGVRESFVNCDLLAQVCITSPTLTGPSIVCSSATYTLNNPLANTTINWSITPTGIANLVPSGNSVTVYKTGEGDATLKATYTACDSEVVFSKDISTVAKIVSITAEYNNCYNGYAAWYLTATPNFSGASNWQWTVDDPSSGSWYIDQPNAQSTWVEVNGGGGISVTYQSPCGGTSESNGTTIWSSCSSFNATMYPNPATEKTVTIDIQQSQKQFTRISSTNTISRDEKYIKEVEIYNIYGHLMKKQTFENNHIQVQIDISNLPTGIYFVKISDGIHRETLRLAVKKR